MSLWLQGAIDSGHRYPRGISVSTPAAAARGHHRTLVGRSTQPLSTQPLSTQPLSTQPLSTQPLSTQPLFSMNDSMHDTPLWACHPYCDHAAARPFILHGTARYCTVETCPHRHDRLGISSPMLEWVPLALKSARCSGKRIRVRYLKERVRGHVSQRVGAGSRISKSGCSVKYSSLPSRRLACERRHG